MGYLIGALQKPGVLQAPSVISLTAPYFITVSNLRYGLLSQLIYLYQLFPIILYWQMMCYWGNIIVQ